MVSALVRARCAGLSILLILTLLFVSSLANGQRHRLCANEAIAAGQGIPDTTKSGEHMPKSGGLKPYKEIITAESKTDKGLFTIHHMNDRLLFEIPAVALDKEMLWSTELAQVPAGFGYGGTAIGSRVIRWTRRNNKIYLRNVDYSLRADSNEKGIQHAIADATLEPIIQAFDVETEGESKSAVIDVTRFLTSDPVEFAVKGEIGGTGVDPARSYVERVKAFPLNVEMRSMLTFTLGEQGVRAHHVGSATVLVHHSMLQLPDKPMRGRLKDSRVGYMTEDFQDFGRPENRAANLRYISRYRLEKKDPQATVSEPVKPIVYYISREVPVQWRPFLKRAVEVWQQAFEKAGFKNAILVKDAPTVEEDPTWDPEDLRYSVMRWAPQAVQDASGPHIHDPRSGEIISGHIIIWHDLLKSVENRYWVECACLDPRAQTLPLPPSLIGELLQAYVTHEVGHTLGLTHNFKASSSFTVQQLRDKAFTEKWGVEASIMDYGRFNYVAQPGDNAYLIPKLGPYDLFAIEWGYKPIPDASSPDDEKPELDRLASKQIDDPTLRFGGADPNGRIDPTVQVEDLGSDPVEATTLGFKNIDRIADMLIPVTAKRGESYERLAELYDALLTQRNNELYNVTKLVGGVIQTDYHAGRGGEVFCPVPKAKQTQAIRFLLDNAFVMPKRLISPQILNRIAPEGTIDRVGKFQRDLLQLLLREDRIKRLSEAQAMDGDRAYTVGDMLVALQAGIWSELAQSAPIVDIYRRNLQRGYLQTLKGLLTGDGATQTELKPVGLGAMRQLRTVINKVLAQKKPLDRETELHLEDSANTITRILNSQVKE